MSDRIATRFYEFHAKNPQVYRLLLTLAWEAREAGHERVGMKELMERARWNYTLHTTGTAPRLNNNYTALYARLIVNDCPELAGLFEFRTRKVAA
jgi:hypothetical protein